MGGEVIASKPEAQYLGVALATQFYGTLDTPFGICENTTRPPCLF